MSDTKLDKDFWNNRYQNQQTGWDIGTVSVPLKQYIDQYTNKNAAILIPGCGNAHEATYLLQQGFTNITLIDIAPLAVDNIKTALGAYEHNELHIFCANFFDLEQTYDLIIEQTFFCALQPALRKAYIDKMADLLNTGGKLAGVLFNIDFVGGPPFGGNKHEYELLFSEKFNIKIMDDCYNSIAPREGSELFFLVEKK